MWLLLSLKLNCLFPPNIHVIQVQTSFVDKSQQVWQVPGSTNWRIRRQDNVSLQHTLVVNTTPPHKYPSNSSLWLRPVWQMLTILTDLILHISLYSSAKVTTPPHPEIKKEQFNEQFWYHKDYCKVVSSQGQGQGQIKAKWRWVHLEGNFTWTFYRFTYVFVNKLYWILVHW